MMRISQRLGRKIVLREAPSVRAHGGRADSVRVTARASFVCRVGLGLVFAAGLCAGGSVVSHTWAAGTPSVCGPSSARALASDRTARVYVWSGNVYGCAAGSDRSYLLGSTNICAFMHNRVGLVRVTDGIAAYTLETCLTDSGWTTVNVRRLTDGKFLRVHQATTTAVVVMGEESVGSLVLKADGAAAWIATADSIGPHTFVRQLAWLDNRGFNVLDSGRALAARSLKLRGSTISWRHGNTVRTARLR
jgi:hypothetical protein